MFDPRLSYAVLPELTPRLVRETVPEAREAFHKVMARRVLVELFKAFYEKKGSVNLTKF